MRRQYFKVLIKSVEVLAFPSMCNMSSALAIIQTQFWKENTVECLIKTKVPEATWAD